MLRTQEQNAEILLEYFEIALNGGILEHVEIVFPVVDDIVRVICFEIRSFVIACWNCLIFMRIGPCDIHVESLVWHPQRREIIDSRAWNQAEIMCIPAVDNFQLWAVFVDSCKIS